jgi:two-component system, NtrC family, nitrogen regulation sensor histidine kinase NtrY
MGIFSLQESFNSFIVFARKYHVWRRLPIILGIVAFFAGVGTYWALTKEQNLSDKTNLLLVFIYIDVTLLLALSALIARRVAELWTQQKMGLAGAKLRIHIVGLFAFSAVAPAICVAVFAAPFFNVGIENWFSRPIRNALDEARVVAESYLKEHQKAIIIDAQSLVASLKPQMATFIENPKECQEFLDREADARGLGEVLIFNSRNEVIARSYLTFALEIAKISVTDFERVKADEIVVREYDDRVRALVRIDPLTDTYLFIGKLIDPQVLSHISRTKGAIQDYLQLSQQHSGAQITFIVFFFLVAFLLLLLSVWVALILYKILVRMIVRFISAAEAVSQGDLSIKIEEEPWNNELDNLAQSFNQMTLRLQQQQKDLVSSQRKAAWSDVARKIAHEIKNPLTPIQLSAERLKRKYSSQITQDPETFHRCIDTIIRQVSHIGSLVNEFSSFARMPDPRITWVKINELAYQTFLLEKQAAPSVQFEYDGVPETLLWECDPLQMAQVITNILQNSINILIESNEQNGIIRLNLKEDDDNLVLTIEDNGPGFPKVGRDKLLEPYYTTREKGTGLGLAIVSKIVSDHNGTMELLDSPELGGALIKMVFARVAKKHER